VDADNEMLSVLSFNRAGQAGALSLLLPGAYASITARVYSVSKKDIHITQ
jgi:hypothetical protein